MTKSSKLTQKRKKGAGKQLRDSTIRNLAMQGKSNPEIAEAVGLSHHQVSRILNNQETKQLVSELENAIKLMGTEAIRTYQDAMANRNEFQMMGHALGAATRVLKSIGAMKDKIDVSHTFPKPTVIRRRNGEDVILGAKSEEDDDVSS